MHDEAKGFLAVNALVFVARCKRLPVNQVLLIHTFRSMNHAVFMLELCRPVYKCSRCQGDSIFVYTENEGNLMLRKHIADL